MEAAMDQDIRDNQGALLALAAENARLRQALDWQRRISGVRQSIIHWQQKEREVLAMSTSKLRREEQETIISISGNGQAMVSSTVKSHRSKLRTLCRQHPDIYHLRSDTENETIVDGPGSLLFRPAAPRRLSEQQRQTLAARLDSRK